MLIPKVIFVLPVIKGRTTRKGIPTQQIDEAGSHPEGRTVYCAINPFLTGSRHTLLRSSLSRVNQQSSASVVTEGKQYNHPTNGNHLVRDD